MEERPKKKGSLRRIMVGILAVLGAFFLLLLFLPDDEEGETERARTEAKVSERGDSTSVASKAKAEAVSVGTDAKSATVMIYMNGSDLETEAGEATEDISEMIASGIGENVNVLIQTMGTRRWQNYGISSKTAQTYRITDDGLSLVRDDLGQLDCTSPETLSEFIGFCKNAYPAERYLFLFWNHGGGPVYGFGYDEWQDEEASLTLAEMTQAFSQHKDIHFDIIGMDCCIMASLETCYALREFCKYTLLSEDFESGLGWSYEDWMRRFEKEPGISTPLLGKYIVDSIISANEESDYGDSSCVALFNESTAQNLFESWKAYAYANESTLFSNNYSRMHRAKGRTVKSIWDIWELDESDVTLSDYYVSDILALIESVDNKSEEAKSLTSALKACVAYYGHTSDVNELTGLAVSLPYGDAEFYDEMKHVFKGIGLDDEYIRWLGGFVSEAAYEDYYDFDGFATSWGGWGDYESEYGYDIHGGIHGKYGYDYGSDTDAYFDYNSGESYDDWVYDYEDGLWYMYDEGIWYSYDEYEDAIYYYDEHDDEWYLLEE